LKIRTFSMEDYPQVRALWEDVGLEIRPGDSPTELSAKLRQEPELFVVAEDRGEVVGTALGGWDGRRGWIYHLGVARSHRRRGVASAVIKELEKRMAEMGIPKVNALIYPSNSASVEFFKRAGFEVQEMKEAGKWLPSKRPRSVSNRVKPQDRDS